MRRPLWIPSRRIRLPLLALGVVASGMFSAGAFDATAPVAAHAAAGASSTTTTTLPAAPSTPPEPATTAPPAPVTTASTTTVPPTTTTAAPSTSAPTTTAPSPARATAVETPSPPATIGTATPNAPATVGGVFAVVNAHRAANGLAPLEYQPDLASCAQGQSAWMASNHSMVHSDLSCPLGVGTAKRWSCCVGENLFYGTTSRYTSAFVGQMWMDSPTHRAQMLEPRYRFAGVGIATSGDGWVWITIHFGG